MSQADPPTRTSISRALTLDEIAAYWDDHSLADHWDQGEEVELEVRAHRQHRVNLDPAIFQRLVQEARLRGVRPETLVNLLLTEALRPARSPA